MKQSALFTSFLVLFLAGASSPAAIAQTTNVFGPEPFTRTSGPTNVFTREFTVPFYVAGPFALRIENGQPSGTDRLTDAISSGTVSINGVEIVHRSDFNQNVATIDRTVTLTTTNTLTVTLNSAPGSYITVRILGAVSGQITDANASDDSLGVANHGFVTGDSVRYDNLGQPAIGGLQPVQTVTNPVGSSHTVIRRYTALNLFNGDGDVDADRLRLGQSFHGGPCAPGVASCVDNERDTITFQAAHNLARGDAVRYAPAFGNLETVGSLHSTDRYFVSVIDERTIKLTETLARASNPRADLKVFTPGDVSGSTISLSGHAFANGSAVTYDAPDPLTFTSRLVDAELVTGSPADCDDPTTGVVEEDCVADRPERDNILVLDESGAIGAHNFVDGDLVSYDVVNPLGPAFPIGNLTAGTIYKVKTLNNSELQLRPTTTTTVHFERADSGGAMDRIVRTDGGSFITGGFRPGTPLAGRDQLDVSGTSIHDGTRTIASITASTITLTSVGAFKATRNTTEVFFDHVTYTCPGSGCTPPPPTNHIRRMDGANWADVTVFAAGMVVTVDSAGSFTITGISGDTLDIAETVSDSIFTGTIFRTPLTNVTLDGPVIALQPDKSAARAKDVHTLLSTTHFPIQDLTDGFTYYVVNATMNTFQLAATPGGSPISLGTVGLGASVPHLIGFQGVDITAASGEHELRIDITSDVTGLQLLLGP